MEDLVEAIINKAMHGKSLFLEHHRGDLLALSGGECLLAKVLNRVCVTTSALSISDLVLAGTVLEQYNVNVLVQVLQATLPRFTGLIFLDLSDNNLGLHGTQALRGVMSSLTDLIELNYANNGIGTMGMQALGLDSFTNLHELRLSGNQLQAPASGLLAEVLPMMTQLYVLELDDNELGVDGMELLAPALTSLPALIWVNLRNNELTARGVQVLQGVLPSLPNLTWLNLSENELGAGAPMMARTLPFMSNLTTLKLSWNDFGAHGLQALAQPLLSLTNLTALIMCAPDSPTHVDWQVATGMEIPNDRLVSGWMETFQFVWDVWMRQTRSVAFAMGLHGRLGQGTYARCLDEELLRIVLEKM